MVFFCRIDLTLQCKGEHFIQIFRAIWLGKTCQIADSSGTQGWYGPCNFRGSGRMKTKKLFWRFSDLGRRHAKLVYYFAPIKSEIFYNSDCYERVRKFVILKVHRIAIFFHRGSWTYCILTQNYRVGSCQRQVTLTLFHSSNYWNQNIQWKPAGEATSIISTSYRMQISLLRL